MKTTLAILFAIAAAAPATAETAGAPDTLAAPSASAAARFEVHAVRLTGPVVIDGVLDEPVWTEGREFDAFTQRDPVEGGPPSQRTEVRVAYDDEALYVGARLYDSAPDSIVRRLARRDDKIASDRFGVYLDPYHDRRSGYYFMVNAAGTLYDGTLSNDVDDDSSWDGVWRGRARMDDRGWTVEMRIPWSQLRFHSVADPVWGIDFERDIPRRRETDYVVYRPRKASTFVSRFPDLVGIEPVQGSAIEVVPYVTGQAEYVHHKPDDPFNDGSRTRGNGGGDLRASLSGMTLKLTANPDFGQVEVDPAVVNLTDVESFFDEKRPFFVEGASTFDFGRQGAGSYWDFDWSDPLMFYSRRIGRAPQGEVPSADFADVPLATRILGAGKLIGRIGPSWSLGTLQAVTDREEARLEDAGRTWRATVEPLTWYGVLRTQREFNGRRRGLGFLGTGTARALEGTGLKDQYNRDAFMGGIDGWVFLDPKNTWVLSGWLAASRLEGTPKHLIDVQRGPLHYLQRPDANYLGVDSTATSLTGFAGRWWLNKQKGAVQFNAGFGFLSPKFDVSDLGYQELSDVMNGHVGTGYQWTHPNRIFTYQSVKAAVFGTADYGSRPLKRGVQLSGYTELQSGWTWDYYGTYKARALNDRRTRGGPVTLDPASVSYGTDLATDSQRSWYAYADFSGTSSASGSWSLQIYPGITWKPAATFNLSIGPGWERLHDDAGRVATISDPTAVATYGKRYVFATLEQRTAYASIRLDWTFTPTLSLQTYLQPFVSSAGYRDFKALVRPGSYEFTPTAYGDNPDFTVRSLKGNAVLRWEFRPGSALFLVWTQKRSSYDTVDAFSVDPKALVDPHPDNVFLTKISWYFTP